jgi:hypothetical protein
MKTKLKLLAFLLLISTTTLWGQNITRLVFFNLKHEAGTPEAVSFFEKTQILGEVPSVSNFGVLRVEGKSFDYDYVIRLGFEDEEGVDVYVKHSIHTDYLAEVWKSNVSGGMLIDLIDMAWDGKQEAYYFNDKNFKPLLTRGH